MIRLCFAKVQRLREMFLVAMASLSLLLALSALINSPLQLRLTPSASAAAEQQESPISAAQESPLSPLDPLDEPGNITATLTNTSALTTTGALTATAAATASLQTTSTVTDQNTTDPITATATVTTSLALTAELPLTDSNSVETGTPLDATDAITEILSDTVLSDTVEDPVSPLPPPATPSQVEISTVTNDLITTVSALVTSGQMSLVLVGMLFAGLFVVIGIVLVRG